MEAELLLGLHDKDLGMWRQGGSGRQSGDTAAEDQDISGVGQLANNLS
jgi:hypothetical protein